MDSLDADIISTRKRKPCLIIDGYQHRLYRKSKDYITWICLKDKLHKCKGKVKTNLQHEVLSKITHSCGAPNAAEIEIKKKLEICRKRAREEVSVPIHKIFKEEIGEIHNKGGSLAVELPTYSNVKSSLCRERRRVLGYDKPKKAESKSEDLPIVQTSNEIPTSEQFPTSNNQEDINNIHIKQEPFEISGRRIIDLKYFLQELQELNNHSIVGCNMSDMDIISEEGRGLISGLTMKCNVCNFTKVIWTEEFQNLTMNSNTAAVAGALSSGGGFTFMEEFFSALNIPSMSENMFLKEQEILSDARESATPLKVMELTAAPLKEMELTAAPLKEMELTAAPLKVEELTANEERNMATEHRDVDSEEILPIVTVVVDSNWGNSSCKTDYSPLPGVELHVANDFQNSAVASTSPENTPKKIRRETPVRQSDDDILGKATDIVSPKKISEDDAQIFGNFVASAIRNLRADESRRILKRKIQMDILEVEELDVPSVVK